MRLALAAAAIAAGASLAHAQDVTVSITNELDAGSFSLTPLWFGFHNGGFDSYDGGSPAAGFPGLEELAEDGLTGPISDAFTASAAGQAGGVQGTLLGDASGAPVFSPGETNSTTINVGDATTNRYFSYASMVVPTNDLFIGNGNPFAHEIFDAAGNFLGPVTILVFGSEVNDAGTEVNDALSGAAFSTNGGDGISEADGTPVLNFFTLPGAADYLDSFIGTGTADGGTVTSAFGAGDLVATITIVPAPTTAAILGVGGLAAMRRRR